MHGSTRSFLLGAVLAALAASVPAVARAEDAPPAKGESRGFATEGSVMAGLTQWVLFRGGNIAGELKIGRFAFEVSHGQGLDLNQVPGVGLTSAERAAGAHVFVPWTTGFGVGVRITPGPTARATLITLTSTKVETPIGALLELPSIDHVRLAIKGENIEVSVTQRLFGGTLGAPKRAATTVPGYLHGDVAFLVKKDSTMELSNLSVKKN
jgi:hypothetical protein